MICIVCPSASATLARIGPMIIIIIILRLSKLPVPQMKLYLLPRSLSIGLYIFFASDVFIVLLVRYVVVKNIVALRKKIDSFVSIFVKIYLGILRYLCQL